MDSSLSLMAMLETRLLNSANKTSAKGLFREPRLWNAVTPAKQSKKVIILVILTTIEINDV